jgi:hypothetical protein
MKPHSMLSLQRALPVLCGLAAVWLPRAAHACPMCFNGANSNSQAFVYGSLLLMFVPVTAIGSLVYWAYRRIRAVENPAQGPATPLTSETSQPGASVVLQMVDRH